MEKIDDPFSRYSKFDNFSRHSDFVRINDSLGNGRLYEYITLIIILLVAICHIAIRYKENGKLKTFYSIYFENFNYNQLIYCMISCLALPILIIIMTTFMLIKLVVHIILKLRYRQKFGGILASADSVWAIEDISRNVINVLVILKLNSNERENITSQIKTIISQNIFQNPRNFPKLTSTRHRFMGFNFLLKDQLTVDDCVTDLEIKDHKEINPADLQDIISEYCNQPLPKHHSSMWQILVGPQPIQWHSREETFNNHPVLLRFSHVAGDGLSFMNLMLRTFANSNVKEIYKNIRFTKADTNDSVEYLESTSSTVFLKTIIDAAKIISNFMHVLSMAPSMLIHQHILRKDDNNSLHGPELSGEKNLVYAVEDQNKLFQIVKDIKNLIPNCRFSDVLFAAISESLSEHFLRNSSPIPKFASAVVPALLSEPDMDQTPILQNQFSVGILNLPIQINSSSMLTRLQKMIEQTYELRKSMQYQVNYWFITYLCGVVPHPILKQSLNTNQLTMTISNVPGVPKVTVMGDYDIEDIIFFTNHRGKTGVGFSILTYDNRFQLGLNIDKSIMASKEKAQMIVNDIIKNIELLHADVCRYNVSTKV